MKPNKTKTGISLVMVLYNDGEIVRDALESAKEIVDEIIIAHDGPCKNNTLDICKEYTDKIFVRPWCGMCEYHQAFLYRKAKYNWILKIDADEYLTKDFQDNAKRLIKNPDADAYSLLWPYWDGNKYITKGYPSKTQFYRKSKIKYLGFTNWGEPKIKGNIIKTNFQLGHYSPAGDPTKWKTFMTRDVKRVTFRQAQDTLKEVNDFDNFQYDETEMPRIILIRRKFPILTAPLFAMYASISSFFDKHTLCNLKIKLKTVRNLFIRYLYLGYYIHKLKQDSSWKN